MIGNKVHIQTKLLESDEEEKIMLENKILKEQESNKAMFNSWSIHQVERIGWRCYLGTNGDTVEVCTFEVKAF